MTPKLIVDVIAEVQPVRLTIFALTWELVDGETGEINPVAAITKSAELEKALQEARSYQVECQQMLSEIYKCTND